MELSLIMVTEAGERREFALTKQRTVIGRQNRCDLRIPLPSVSRQHCEILARGDEAELRDLGSSNGTYHNHNRIQSVQLSAGDEVMVGPVVFTVVIDNQPATLSPVPTVLEDTSSEEPAQSDGETPGEAAVEPTAEKTGNDAEEIEVEEIEVEEEDEAAQPSAATSEPGEQSEPGGRSEPDEPDEPGESAGSTSADSATQSTEAADDDTPATEPDTASASGASKEEQERLDAALDDLIDSVDQDQSGESADEQQTETEEPTDNKS